MISPTFLIKILGCTTVGAFLTIGVPVIVVQKNKAKEAADKAKEAADKAKEAAAIQTDNTEITAIKPSESKTTEVTQRQKEIDEPTNITKFLTKLVSVAQNLDPVIKSGETFSDKAIKQWTPTTEEKTAIVTNFSEITKHMPNEFFEKLTNKNLTQRAGVCHIMTYNTTIGSKGPIRIYIPFLKKDIKTIKDNHLESVTAKVGSIVTHVGEFLKTNKNNFKTELTEIVAGRKVPAVRLYSWYHYAWRHQTSTEEKAIAKDLLFLQTLYEGTIDRLTKELGNPDTSQKTVGGIIWEVSC